MAEAEAADTIYRNITTVLPHYKYKYNDWVDNIEISYPTVVHLQ